MGDSDGRRKKRHGFDAEPDVPPPGRPPATQTNLQGITTQVGGPNRGAPVKDKMCMGFAKGVCNLGHTCKYAHSVSDLAPGGTKGRLCPSHLKGMCLKGDRCLYAHTKDELPQGYKSKLCMHFTAGKPCKRDDECFFAHGQAELDFYSTPETMAQYKTRLCKTWPNCSNGAACSFAHGEHELRPISSNSGSPVGLSGPGFKTRPCKNYPGFCPRGAACTFAHGDQELEAHRSQSAGSKGAAKGNFSSGFSGPGDFSYQDGYQQAIGFGDQSGGFANQRSGFSNMDGMGVGNSEGYSNQPTGFWNNDEYKLKWCSNYLSGSCSSSTSCPFAHDVFDFPPGFKQSMCQFAGNNCNKGESCMFAHSNDEMKLFQGLNPESGGPSVPQLMMVPPNLKSSVNLPELAMQSSSTQPGWQVSPAAGAAFTAPSAGNSFASLPGQKTAMCGQFLVGQCQLGASCLFAHSEKELQSSRGMANGYSNDGSDNPAGGNDQPASTPLPQAGQGLVVPPPPTFTQKSKFNVPPPPPGPKLEAQEEAKGEAWKDDQKELQNLKRKVCTFSHEKKYKSQICGDLLEGECEDGKDCEFAHTADELPPGFKRSLCEENQCNRGEHCFFAHSEEELRAFAQFIEILHGKAAREEPSREMALPSAKANGEIAPPPLAPPLHPQGNKDSASGQLSELQHQVLATPEQPPEVQRAKDAMIAAQAANAAQKLIKTLGSQPEQQSSEQHPSLSSAAERLMMLAMGQTPAPAAQSKDGSGGAKRTEGRKSRSRSPAHRSRSRSRDRRQSCRTTTVREKHISPPRGISPPKWQTTDVDELIREVEDAVKSEDVVIPQLVHSRTTREEEVKARSPSPKKNSSKTDEVDDEIRKLREENEKLKAEMAAQRLKKESKGQEDEKDEKESRKEEKNSKKEQEEKKSRKDEKEKNSKKEKEEKKKKKKKKRRRSSSYSSRSD